MSLGPNKHRPTQVRSSIVAIQVCPTKSEIDRMTVFLTIVLLLPQPRAVQYQPERVVGKLHYTPGHCLSWDLGFVNCLDLSPLQDGVCCSHSMLHGPMPMA